MNLVRPVAEIVRKDCGDTMWNMGGPAADATSECTPSYLGHHTVPYCKPWEAGRGPGNEASTVLQAMGSWAGAWEREYLNPRSSPPPPVACKTTGEERLGKRLYLCRKSNLCQCLWSNITWVCADLGFTVHTLCYYCVMVATVGKKVSKHLVVA